MTEANEIILDNRIYPESIINTAINEYSSIAEISYMAASDAHKIKISFSNFDQGFETTRHEFCNYLIDLYAASIG